MNVTLRNSFLAVVIGIISFLCASTFVYAQIDDAVQLKPATFEERVDPGQAYPLTLRVKNISNVSKTFFLNTEDITGLNDQGLPIFSDETEISPYELSSWVELPESQITLAPNEEKSVSFTVRVPKDASPGSHFGGIFVDTRPQKQRENGTAVGVKVGSIISLRISGEANEEAQLREFSTSHIVYGSAAKIDFNARIANLGNVLVRPHGLIEITSMAGSKVGIVKVNDTGAGVFPAADKTFTQAWEYDGLAFGRYQAVMSLVYGEDGRKTISAATSFWVLPLKPILSVLGGIFAVLLVLYVLVRMYVARKIREMGGGRGGAALYARRNQSPVSKLLIITLALIFLAIIFLILLFLMFA